MLLCYFCIHGKIDGPEAKMSRRAAAQLGNVERFSKIHLEQSPLAERHGQQVKLRVCAAHVDLVCGLDRFLNRCFVARLKPSLLNVWRRVISVMAREPLLNLGAAAVAMHIAKAADVHEDVKLELLPSIEAPQKFIMPNAMAHSYIDT